MPLISDPKIPSIDCTLSLEPPDGAHTQFKTLKALRVGILEPPYLSLSDSAFFLIISLSTTLPPQAQLSLSPSLLPVSPSPFPSFFICKNVERKYPKFIYFYKTETISLIPVHVSYCECHIQKHYFGPGWCCSA